MPRIDPLQLLKCLSVLLSPEGGILSRDEVPRLVNLMTKFSKKLVSKCVYVLILKNTETSLVDMFMAEGGWTLIQNWLQDAAQSGNWDLVKEILGLLLITPVDVERLKMNCLPKLIKNLSRREDLGDVAQLSNQIVQNWLIIVKGSAHGAIATASQVQAQAEKRENETAKPAPVSVKEVEDSNMRDVKSSVSQEQSEVREESTAEVDQTIKTSTFYKVAVKDCKQVIKKHSAEGDKTHMSDEDSSDKNENNKEEKDSSKDVKSTEKAKSSKSSSSSKSKSSSSSSREKDRDKDKKNSSHSSSSKSKTSSKSKDKDRKDKDKERDRKDRDKDRSKHSSSSKSGSKSSSSKDKKESKDKNKSSDSKDSKDPKESVEKQAEKDKDTLEKLKPQTLDKLGRIPKKPSSDEKQKENKPKENPEKKPSFSILNRKATGEERSKTVKVFNSKMRSTGLEEEAKPPPPRSAKKPTPSVQLPTIPPKRPTPPREPSISMPPEKKLRIDKLDIPERPGAIKLIPPKPKPPVLQESDMFMDALTASAPKKEAKKRKRRPSVSKDAPTSPSSSPIRDNPQTPTSPTSTSPTTALGLKNIAPINFYQDTLSEETEQTEGNKDENAIEENKEITENNTNSLEDTDTPASPPAVAADVEIAMESEDLPSPPKQIKLDAGLKGVLLYSKKKGPKRSIRWREEENLVEVRYFELDETERVNVTKTFMDMAKMDISCEREALIMSRKLPNEDVMEPQTMWRMLYLCEQADPLAVPGSKSLEKDIQFAREKSVLPALYFDKRRIPDSSEEPIPENHQMSDPVIIPLEDPESQEIDLRGTPWPESKGAAPQIEQQPISPMFQNMPFNPNFNNMGNMPPVAQFVGVPSRFPGPPGPHGSMPPVPGNFGPPNMMHNNMMGPPINQPDMMNAGPMNQGVYAPTPDGFIGPINDSNYPMQQFNGPQGPNMNNMFAPNNFNPRGGGGGTGVRGGGYRRGGNNGGWVQSNGPRNWKRGGGGPRGGRMCKNILNHGYCRNGDNCPFLH